MLGDTIKNKFQEILGLFVFLVFVTITSTVCLYFNAILALPAFLASLFFIYVLPNSPYSGLKNIIGSYLIASAAGYFGLKLLMPILGSLSKLTGGVIETAIITFIVGLVTIIIGMEHPPAIAAVVFWVFSEIGGKQIIGFVLCWAIILITGIIVMIIHQKRGFGLGKGADFGKDFDLGKEPDLGGLGDLGKLK